MDHPSESPLAPNDARPRVLMLTHRLPYPPDRGDRIRSYHLVRALGTHFHLSLACTSVEPASTGIPRDLQPFVQRLAVRRLTRSWSGLRSLWALAAGRAITPTYHFRADLADVVLQWHRSQPFHSVLTFCTGMVDYARFIQGARQVLDLVDVDSLKWREYARHSIPPLRWVFAAEARRLQRIESDGIRCFDAITVISDAEAQAYRRQVGEHPHLHVVNNGVDLDYFAPQPDAAEQTIAFVGVLNYRPNVEGIRWFVREVWPLLRRRNPQATLLIVGRDPAPGVRQLSHEPGVQVVGPVPDVRVYLGQAAAVIAPLLLARGVQNKVLEAMASARAVVCSPPAAEGIEALAGRDLLVAEQPGQWVEHLQRLLTDGPYRQQIASAARQQVQSRYDWSTCLQPMIDLLGGHG